MKELSYKNSNANKMKIAFAKRKKSIALCSLLAIVAIVAVSVFGSDLSEMFNNGTAIAYGVVTASVLPFMIGGQFKELQGEELKSFLEKSTPEELGAYHKALADYKNAELQKAIDNKADKSVIEKLVNDISKINVEAITKEVIELQAKVKALQENGLSKEDKDTLRGTLKSYLATNKEKIEAIKNGTKAELPAFVVKLNSPMLPSNTYNGSAYIPTPEFIQGATEIVRVKPTFWDYLKKGIAGSSVLVWVNKKNPEGAAAFIAPGVAKPGVSFEIASETSNAKKIAVSEKCATELLQDIDAMMSWIEQEMIYQLKAKINTTLMTGVASSTVPAGIQTLSTAYTLTTVKTTNPNNFDAIRACVAQLTSGNLVGPVTAFVNPIDKANMDLTKAQSQGQLFIPGDAGALIVEDNNIPVGYVQVALLDYYKVSVYKEFQLTWGWENDDFTKNLVTAVAEMRIHQWFSENHTGAFIYDTFDNIKTAITEV